MQQRLGGGQKLGWRGMTSCAFCEVQPRGKARLVDDAMDLDRRHGMYHVQSCPNLTRSSGENGAANLITMFCQ